MAVEHLPVMVAAHKTAHILIARHSGPGMAGCNGPVLIPACKAPHIPFPGDIPGSVTGEHRSSPDPSRKGTHMVPSRDLGMVEGQVHHGPVGNEPEQAHMVGGIGVDVQTGDSVSFTVQRPGEPVGGTSDGEETGTPVPCSRLPGIDVIGKNVMPGRIILHCLQVQEVFDEVGIVR